MVFIETPIFTADVCALLSDEEYAALQQHLVAMPNAGAVIAGTGGLRKIRWAVAGKGKRGGTRVIYYHVVAQAQIRMILIYRKGIKDDLTPKEKTVLRKIIGEWLTVYKKLFKRLVDSMGQMDEIVRGVRAPSREFYVDAAKVKEIRAITGLSQPKFAKLLHVDVGTLRNWEQGRREPTGPARALLRAIKNNPQAVLKALAA